MRQTIWIGALVLATFGCSDTLGDGAPWSVDEGADPTVATPGHTPNEPSGTTGTSTEPVTRPDPGPLSGNWIQANIGNCIDIEQWWSFGESSQFRHVIADRNACYESSLAVADGEWKVNSSAQLEFEWAAPDAVEKRVITYAIVDDGQQLNTTAFRQDGNSFVRHDEHLLSNELGYTDTTLDVAVTFDPFPELGPEDDCRMHVEMKVSIDLGGNAAPLEGTEIFDFDCQYQEVEQSDLRVISAIGYDERGNDRWYEEFRARRIWDRHPVQVSNLLYDSFRPVLYVDPEVPNLAFTRSFQSWFWRTDEAPPSSTEDLDRNL